MDNALHHTFRELAARRDDRLREGPTIPSHRLQALRDAAQRQAANTAADPGWGPWLASFRASVSPRLCVAAAAACLLVLAALLRTAVPSATRDRAATFNVVSSVSQAPVSAFERADAPTLTLRVPSADLLQMQTGFLARTALQNRASDELTAVSFDLTLDTAVDQLQ